MDHGSVPTHNHGKVIIYPFSFFLHLFCSLPHPENHLAATGGGRGCSGDPQAGWGAQPGPMPSKQGKGIWDMGPCRAHPSCLLLRSGSSLCFVFSVCLGQGCCGFWVCFFFALSSSVGQIPSAAKRRRDNQPPPRPEQAKPQGSLCALRQGKQPWAPQNPPQG